MEHDVVGEKAYEIMMQSSIITEKRPSLSKILTEIAADSDIEKLI